MQGFIGEDYHSVDAKGRVIIPQKYREGLGDEFMLSKGLDGCLWIHPMEDWDEFSAKLKTLPMIDKESRIFKRFFLSGATRCCLDKQGRILIPASLRTYAKIDKDAVLVGMDNRIEVWSRQQWDDQNDISEEDMDKVSEHLAQIGFVF